MSWDTVVLWILAACGATGVLLTQATDLIGKVERFVRAWRAMRRSLRAERRPTPTHPRSRTR